MKRRFVRYALLIVTLVAVFTVCGAGMTAFAEESGKVGFYLTYSDSDGENVRTLYATADIVDGSFTVPDTVPDIDGYSFVCWFDGGMGRYYAGKTYTTSADTLTLSSVMDPDGDAYEFDPKPLFSTAEKALLWTAVGVVGAVLLVVLYWCGIKQRSIKELFPAIKKALTKK